MMLPARLRSRPSKNDPPVLERVPGLRMGGFHIDGAVWPTGRGHAGFSPGGGLSRPERGKGRDAPVAARTGCSSYEGTECTFSKYEAAGLDAM
jgi:hypothetical protein